MPEKNPDGTPRVSKVKKFVIKYGDLLVNAGISESGALVLYGFSNPETNEERRFGKFPITLFASQVHTMNTIWPAVMAYVEQDRHADTPMLAYKANSAATTNIAEIAITPDDPLVAVLMKQGKTREQALELAALANGE